MVQNENHKQPSFIGTGILITLVLGLTLLILNGISQVNPYISNFSTYQLPNSISVSLINSDNSSCLFSFADNENSNNFYIENDNCQTFETTPNSISIENNKPEKTRKIILTMTIFITTIFHLLIYNLFIKYKSQYPSYNFKLNYFITISLLIIFIFFCISHFKISNTFDNQKPKNTIILPYNYKVSSTTLENNLKYCILYKKPLVDALNRDEFIILSELECSPILFPENNLEQN